MRWVIRRVAASLDILGMNGDVVGLTEGNKLPKHHVDLGSVTPEMLPCANDTVIVAVYANV